MFRCISCDDELCCNIKNPSSYGCNARERCKQLIHPARAHARVDETRPKQPRRRLRPRFRTSPDRTDHRRPTCGNTDRHLRLDWWIFVSSTRDLYLALARRGISLARACRHVILTNLTICGGEDACRWIVSLSKGYGMTAQTSLRVFTIRASSRSTHLSETGSAYSLMLEKWRWTGQAELREGYISKTERNPDGDLCAPETAFCSNKASPLHFRGNSYILRWPNQTQ